MKIQELLEGNDISYATKKNWERLGTINFGSRLISRANKRFSQKRFIPKDYLRYTKFIEKAYFYQSIGYSVEEILFSIVLNLTKNVENKYLMQELNSWNIEESRIIEELLNLEIENEFILEILGRIYQSLLSEGEKNIKGSYYTPNNIVEDIVKSHFQDGMKFIDPCSGTGQFLLQVNSTNPLNIWGVDIDETAVKIAKINLILKYNGIDFLPNIFCLDSLDKFDENILKSGTFDLVATNPPWGSKIDKLYIGYKVKSRESFSFFIERGIDLLKEGGILSYILPESILNVKTHEDIRAIMLDYDILSIHELGRIFPNVFTKAIRIDIKKQNEDGNIEIHGNEKYFIDKSLFKNNSYYTFSCALNGEKNDLINKVYSKKSIYLNNENSLWALGIVTGNNKLFISDEKKSGYIPIYTGKEINNYFLKDSKKYILYEPHKYQQKAPLHIYETKPKLIYKFISKKLVFALDETGGFTLNSANIIIPKIDYSLKVILALFNSDLYQQIFQKKFNSIKVLKSHIQELPLPILERKDIDYIEKLVDEMIISRKLDKKQELDDYIFNLLTK